MNEPRIASTATVEEGATIGGATSVWDLATVRRDAVVGAECTIGRGAFIDLGVRVGDRCKIQNDALLYAPATLGDGVFIGPRAVLTNDRFPRAVNPDGSRKETDNWHAEGVVVDEGASVGAAAVVLGGVRVGAWSLVGMGAVVVRDVVPYGLVAGAPARRIGWVGRAGVPLDPAGEDWECPQTGERYGVVDDGRLELR